MKDSKVNDQVLVLPSWYPNKLDKYAGDFIQRHVKAIALYQTQYVLHFVKDENAIITNDIAVELYAAENYTEKIIYYHPKKTGITVVDKYLSFRKFNKAFKQSVNEYINDKGKTKFVHVHVTLKAGIIALWIKKKWAIPFLLSEQWTIYLPEANERVSHLSFIYKRYLTKILKEAKAVSVVSKYLGDAIGQLYPFINYSVIPNVVDTTLFYPVEKQERNLVKFIHASIMGYQKNVEAILTAFKILKNKGVPFTADLFGPVHVPMQELVLKLQLNEEVFFKGEVEQPVLAKEMQQADALILFSRFETFGCVIIEAQACGLPVIASDLEIFSEIITPSINGLFAQNNNPADLAEKLIYFIENKKSFNKAVISKETEKYNFMKIGEEFKQFYSNAMS